MADLRAVIVVDYQNVHLTGHGLFDSSRHAPCHEYLIDPLLFAQQLISTRNAAQRPDMAAAVLRRVLVYRGQPSADHDPKPYARNQAQKAQWERDRRVEVTLRPLKYDDQRDADGRVATDGTGRRIVTGKQEKGVDVLRALALVREAARPDVDLVVLALQDTDLEPALDEALALGTAKVETVTWSHPTRHTRQLRPNGSRRLWNTPAAGNGASELPRPDRLPMNRGWSPRSASRRHPHLYCVRLARHSAREIDRRRLGDHQIVLDPDAITARLRGHGELVGPEVTAPRGLGSCTSMRGMCSAR